MREHWAKRLALLTGVLLVGIAAILAMWQNRSPATGATPATDVISDVQMPPSSATSGRAVYAAQGCARCHSIAGEGNPRVPLDGVGRRRNATQLRQWTTADPAIADALSARTRSVKEGFAALPAADLDALVEFLQGL